MHSVAALLLSRGHGHTQLFKKDCQAILSIYIYFKERLFLSLNDYREEAFSSPTFVQGTIHEKCVRTKNSGTTIRTPKRTANYQSLIGKILICKDLQFIQSKLPISAHTVGPYRSLQNS